MYQTTPGRSSISVRGTRNSSRIPFADPASTANQTPSRRSRVQCSMLTLGDGSWMSHVGDRPTVRRSPTNGHSWWSPTILIPAGSPSAAHLGQFGISVNSVSVTLTLSHAVQKKRYPPNRVSIRRRQRRTRAANRCWSDRASRCQLERIDPRFWNVHLDAVRSPAANGSTLGHCRPFR
jgi:hypothetical protein